jgi:hypothetical protein
MAQRTQIAFLRGVFGIGRIVEQVTCQRVDVVEVGSAASRKRRAFVR